MNCEKSILSANVDFHERYECPDFDKLYQMTFQQLAKVTEGKAEAVRQKLREKLAKLKAVDESGRSQMALISEQLL